MRKLLFFLALGALAVPSTPLLAQNPAVVAAPDLTPFLWKLSLQTGQKWLTTTETTSRTWQQLPAPPNTRLKPPPEMETTFKNRFETEQNVLSSDEKGARVAVTYREITQSSKTRQGDKVIFDSENPPAGMKPMSNIADAVVGAKLTYLLSPSGQISDIQGVEEYLARLKAAIEKSVAGTPQAAALQKTMGQSMAAFLSPESVKSAMSELYSAMPRQAVTPGASWDYSLDFPMMGTTFNQSGQSTFISRRNGKVSITQNGQFSTDAGAEFKVPLPPPRDKDAPAPVSQLDLQGTSNGELSVDEQSGLVLMSRSSQKIQGELVVSGLTGRGSTLSIPMKIEVETLVTSEELKTTP